MRKLRSGANRRVFVFMPFIWLWSRSRICAEFYPTFCQDIMLSAVLCTKHREEHVEAVSWWFSGFGWGLLSFRQPFKKPIPRHEAALSPKLSSVPRARQPFFVILSFDGYKVSNSYQRPGKNVYRSFA